MEQAIEFKLSKRVFELGNDRIVSLIDVVPANLQVPNMTKQKAITRATTIAMISILVMPLIGLMAGDEKIWEKLQSLVEAERAAKTPSAVLAVDTTALNVRSKNASPSTKELFEQAAMENLARLHHTFNSWAERNQELMGSVVLKLAVDSRGNVVRVEPVNGHVNDSSFMKTVIDDVREWKFPNGSTEAAEITVPLLFIPKGMDPEMIVQWERKVRGGSRDQSPEKLLPVAIVPSSIRATEKVAIPAAVTQSQKSTIALTEAATKANSEVRVAPTPKPKAEEKALAVVLANRQLAIRANPRYSANSVQEVEESTPLSILENRGDWLKVRTAKGGVAGFIRKEYVSPVNG